MIHVANILFTKPSLCFHGLFAVGATNRDGLSSWSHMSLQPHQNIICLSTNKHFGNIQLYVYWCNRNSQLILFLQRLEIILPLIESPYSLVRDEGNTVFPIIYTGMAFTMYAYIIYPHHIMNITIKHIKYQGLDIYIKGKILSLLRISRI